MYDLQEGVPRAYSKKKSRNTQDYDDEK